LTANQSLRPRLAKRICMASWNRRVKMEIPTQIDREQTRRLAARFDEAMDIIANEFTALDTHQQYRNAFSRLLKWDPLGRPELVDLRIALREDAVPPRAPVCSVWRSRSSWSASSECAFRSKVGGNGSCVCQVQQTATERPLPSFCPKRKGLYPKCSRCHCQHSTVSHLSTSDTILFVIIH
jgi:hypothetical protein